MAETKAIEFRVGCNIGTDRYEEGDTAPAHVLSPETRKAWLEQGLIRTAGKAT